MAELYPPRAATWPALRHGATASASTSTPRRPTASTCRSTSLSGCAADPDLAGWDGLGFVVQAYGKRCPFVIDVLIDLARRSRRRLMVRLVKGAYWDSEIKRAQVDGLSDFPVFTRKVHTDVSYLACARRLLAAPDAVFPQFATHNAQTLASIVASWPDPGFPARPVRVPVPARHGRTRSTRPSSPARSCNGPCRIYAPVGTHETLLAYLVRRLLENRANTSFVNRVADEAVPVADLIADPVAVVEAEPDPGAPHPRIAAPRDLYGPGRANAAGPRPRRRGGSRQPVGRVGGERPHRVAGGAVGRGCRGGRRTRAQSRRPPGHRGIRPAGDEPGPWRSPWRGRRRARPAGRRRQPQSAPPACGGPPTPSRRRCRR